MGPPPWTKWETDTTENITFATPLAGGKNALSREWGEPCLTLFLPARRNFIGGSVLLENGTIIIRPKSRTQQGSHLSGKTEIFEDFFQSGKMGFWAKIRENFSKLFSNHLVWEKMFFKDCKNFFSGTDRKLHLMRQYLHRLMSLRPHLKRINIFFY